MAQRSTENRGSYDSATDTTAVSLTGGGVAVTEAAALSVTTGATAQEVFAANTSRKFFQFVNNSTGDLTVRYGATNATATAGIVVQPGGSITEAGPYVPTSKISVYGATTGQGFYAVEG